ncbi:MAG: protein kinase [Clostridia bacterium]
MNEQIGEYKRLTPMQTAGSGSARWCIAQRGRQRFFLKQFLSPVYPALVKSALSQKQCERCAAFEKRKQRMYTALSCVIGDTLVPVLDFFRFERRYFAVSEAVPEPYQTSEDLRELSTQEKHKILFELAQCLQRLHMQGIVHADLKPEHVLLIKRPTGYRVRLIDLDSGFLADDPPPSEREMEGDPVYLAPEAFLRMVGQEAETSTKLDTFAFGAMIHHFWTGELPSFDTAAYTYLYEAALDGGKMTLSRELPKGYAELVKQMLCADPSLRPDDAEIVLLLTVPQCECNEKQTREQRDEPINGLSRYMKK